jgi:hypothetical protein
MTKVEPGATPSPLHPIPLRSTAALGLMLGLAGMGCLPWKAFEFGLNVDAVGPGDTPVTAIASWSFVAWFAGLAVSVLLVIASVGLLRLKAWSRRAMLAYALATILLGLASGVIYAKRYAMPAGARMSSGVGGCLEICVWAGHGAFSLYVLYAMTRPETVAALAEARRVRADLP